MTTSMENLRHGLSLAWDDPELVVASDNRDCARYRSLQAHYRHHHLYVGVGLDRVGVPRKSALPSAAVEEHPGLNFLGPEITEYVQARSKYVIRQGGTIDEHRLYHNMLSSMPLCFNLFGYLRMYPISAAKVLGDVLELDIASVTKMEVEWIPQGKHPLGDKTAFDAYVEYLTSNGELGFLGIETKYTESFSPTEYDKETYRSWTTPEQGFLPGAPDILKSRKTNQLWRNLLLTLAVRASDDFKHGHVVVVAREDDQAAKDALSGVKAQLRDPDNSVRFASLESLLMVAGESERLRAWSESFYNRYLNLESCEREPACV